MTFVFFFLFFIFLNWLFYSQQQQTSTDQSKAPIKAKSLWNSAFDFCVFIYLFVHMYLYLLIMKNNCVFVLNESLLICQHKLILASFNFTSFFVCVFRIEGKFIGFVGKCIQVHHIGNK